jgi:hypothetical protein
MKRSLEERLLDPRPGSKVAAAKEFGIDLTLLLRQLKLTPEQRLMELQEEMESFEALKQEVEKSKQTGINGKN